MRRLIPLVLGLAAAFAAGLFAAPVVHAARLRPSGTLTAAVVRLDDLFADAGPNADRVLGPAPPPGERITVPAAQLGAIARQYGVDWRPFSAAEEIVLERAGTPLAREEVTAALGPALRRAGAPEGSEIELFGFAPPMLPIAAGAGSGASARLAVTRLDYDAASGRFAASLAAAVDAGEPLRLRVVGQAHATVEVPVLASRLPSGAVLRAEDVRMARVRTALIHVEIARAPAEAVGMALRRATLPDQPLPLGDLVHPALVRKGGAVRIVLDAPGLSVTAQGVALDAGALGDAVRVRNPTSLAVLQASVIGPDAVRLEPGTAPVQPGARVVAAAP
jgi:flagella basal body P-ring formation protein FlgA